MKYRVELRGKHGERIIIGSSRKEPESIHDAITKANLMKDIRETLAPVDKPMFYVPRGWLSGLDLDVF